MHTFTFAGFDGKPLTTQEAPEPIAHLKKLGESGYPFRVLTVDGEGWGEFAARHQVPLAKLAKELPNRTVIEEQIEGTVQALKGTFKPDLSVTGIVAAAGVPGLFDATKHKHLSAVGFVLAEEMMRVAEERGDKGPALIGAKFWASRVDVSPQQMTALTEKFQPSLFAPMHNETLLEVWNHTVGSKHVGKAQGLIGIYGPQLLSTGLSAGDVRQQVSELFPELPGKTDRLMKLVNEKSPDPGNHSDPLESGMAKWRAQDGGRLELLWNGVEMVGSQKAVEPETLTLSKGKDEDAGGEEKGGGPGLNVKTLAADLGQTEKKMNRTSHRRGSDPNQGGLL